MTSQDNVTLDVRAKLVNQRNGDSLVMEKGGQWGLNMADTDDDSDGWVSPCPIVAYKPVSVDDVTNRKFVNDDKILIKFDINIL